MCRIVTQSSTKNKTAQETTTSKLERNGFAENAVRRVKEGTSALLVQSGLSGKVVGRNDEMLLFIRNIHDKLANGKSTYERRIGTPLDSPLKPFGVDIFGADNLHERQKVVFTIWYQDGSRNTHRIRLEFFRKLDWRLVHRGLARHREQRGVGRSTSKESSSKKYESRTCKKEKYVFAPTVH